MPTTLQVLVWTWCLTALGLAEDVPSEVPILKQINRVNDDGSYTFGYEAADGSFKIETRDVQGNVKGMFGYIDEDGELKRVSYTANNGTGFHSLSTTEKPKEETVNHSTRRPLLILRQSSSTRAPVIQHIPRKVTGEYIQSTTTTPVYGEYIKGRKPVMEVFANGASSESESTTEENKVTTTPSPVRRILVTRRPLSLEDKPSNRVGKGGNALRRQLGSETSVRAADSPDVYPDSGNPRYLGPGSRFQNPILASLLPQSSPAFRNSVVAQNGGRVPPFLLRPDQNIDPTYQPPFDPQEGPDVTTVAPVPPNFPTQHRLFPEGPIPPLPQGRFRSPVDQQYPAQNGVDGRRYRPIPPVPQISPVLQNKPLYPGDPNYNPGQNYPATAVQSLRDELMEYLLQYLQQRTGRFNPGFTNRAPIPPQYNPGYNQQFNPYNQYPVQNPPYYNPGMPYNPYPNQYFPYPNQNPGFNPYYNPNYPIQGPPGPYPNMQPIYPQPQPQPYPPIPIGAVPPSPPYSNSQYPNPNIQYSAQQQSAAPSQNFPQQFAEPRINPILRNLPPSNPVNEQQQELFKTLVAASTSATPNGFSSTTDAPKRSTQPVRNVQILGSASEIVTQRISTASTPTRDEMEETSR